MKQIAVCMFLVAAFTVAANAQCGDRSVLGWMMAGPCAERYARQAYAPVDYYLNNGYGYGGYGYYGSRLGTSAIVGAASGAIAGGLVAAVVSHNNRTATVYAAAPNGGSQREVIFAQPKQAKAPKPLDCRKINSKNRTACETAAAEITDQQATAERQACLSQLAASSWRLRNSSDRFTFAVTENGQPLTVCGEPLVLRPLQTIRIFPPNGQIGGTLSGAGISGEKVELTAKVRPVNQPGFIGFVLMAPGAPEGGN